ncbi:MAG: cysteine desulfurase [Geminicoccaceae bacterium]|nr:cysteine desulfurase [Geminicoccaceae bacterium]
MASRPVYLDCNASMPMRPEAVAACMEGLALAGNPASVHAPGRKARAALERARAVIAGAVGADARNVVLTSGATEANFLAMSQTSGRRAVSAVEHPSILEAGAAARIGVDRNGIIDPASLDIALSSGPTLVSIMLVNNETGVIQDIEALSGQIREAGALLHVDAVQALGRIPVDIDRLGADMISISAHKIGGPRGIGALVLRDGLEIDAVFRGGGQERRRRGGTENVAGAMGFAAAIDAVAGDETVRIAALRERLEGALAGEAEIVARDVARVINCTALAMPGVSSAVQVMNFDLEGIAISAGSACSSGKVSRSHVLDAMGTEREIADSTIRVSIGWTTTEAEIDRFTDVWRAILARCATRRVPVSGSA